MLFKKIKSHAKINLALNIIGKSVYLHKIESIIAFISLHDQILIRQIKSNKNHISFSGRFSNDIGKKNTVSSLFNLLEKKKFLKNKKFQVKIKKNIPTQAGLGGGSMNAANILSFLIRKKIIKISKKELKKISYSIGSDVILGLKNTNSILTSKNKIKNFINCKKINILVVKPNFGFSTGDIYAKVRKFNKPKYSYPKASMFNLDYLKKQNNSLETVAFAKNNKMRILKSYLESLPATIFVRMTGSGSALVAYFKSKENCDNAKKKFIKKYKNYWCITSKTI